MALATRCPNCQVLFRVVADQLKLRGGLVRCGACRHVFDAIGSLTYIEDSAAAPPEITNARRAAPPTLHASAIATPVVESAIAEAAPAPAPAPAPPAESRRNEGSGPPTLMAPPEDERTDASGDETSRRRSGRAEPTGESRTRDAAPESPGADAKRSRGEADRAGKDDAVVPPPGPKRRRRRPAQEELRASAAEGEAPEQNPGDDDAADEPAFLREARRRRSFSVVFGGGSLLLALVMLIQLAVIFRIEMTARWPQSRPVLVQLCGIFGCTVGWPARAELLAVVGTELQSIPGTDVLELTAIVRNRANFKVALPAIEVTLTDTTNRTLARKVFAPVDYLASAGEPSSRIDDGLGPASDLTIRVAFEARGINAVGFVVYPFYL